VLAEHPNYFNASNLEFSIRDECNSYAGFMAISVFEGDPGVMLLSRFFGA
jgi:hypothetical protein